jgi:hypothetical protein
MFRGKVLQQTEPPAPAPAAPLTPEQELELAARALKNAQNYCAKLDEEWRMFASRREAAHKIFVAALRRHAALQEVAEKIQAGGSTEPVVLATGSVLP